MAQGDGVTSVTLSSGDRSVTLDGSFAAKAEAALQQPYRGPGALHMVANEPQGRVVDTATGEVSGAEPEAGRPPLVTGGNPEARPTIPRPSSFVNKKTGEQTDFMDAPDIERIANALIGTCADLDFLEEVHIRYRWRRKGQNKAGKIVLGYCQKLSGQLRDEMGGGDFQIVLNAENCGLRDLRAWQLEALVYHELNHIAPPDEDDPESVPTLIGHDVEMFTSEVRRYGLWTNELRMARKAFNDLPLFAGLSEE